MKNKEQTLETATGICRYCGAGIILEDSQLMDKETGEVFDPEEAATRNCDCYQAQRYQKQTRAKKELRSMLLKENDDIEEDGEKKLISSEQRNLELLPWLENTIDHLTELRIDKMQVVINGTKVAFSINKDDKIKIKTSQTQTSERTL